MRRAIRCLWQEKALWGWVDEQERVILLDGPPYAGGSPLFGSAMPMLGDVQLLAPCLPSKIVAVGKNYEDHIREFDGQKPETPVLFLKPPSAVIGPGEAIVLPPSELSDQVDFEGELALVIGREARKVTPEQAAGCILGYTILNDVTARDIQRADGQWVRAKGFDTFAPVGPWIVTETDVSDRAIRTRLNGELRQESRTSMQIWPPAELVSFISQSMTLFPGDVVTTGTPAGVGRLSAGDRVEIEIESVGILGNPVVAG